MTNLSHEEYFQQLIDMPDDHKSIKQQLAEKEREQLRTLLQNMAASAIAAREITAN